MQVDEGREFFRINVRLPIEFRRLTHAEYNDMKNLVRYGSTSQIGIGKELNMLRDVIEKEEGEKKRLFSCLEAINRKLDMVIELMKESTDNNLYIKKFLDVNLSGSGIKFLSDEEFVDEEYVEIKMVIPVFPYPKITMLCQVVRVEKKEVCGTVMWEVALMFKTINEDDRDFIVNFIFTKERELLRSKKELSG